METLYATVALLLTPVVTLPAFLNWLLFGFSLISGAVILRRLSKR
jgi:hypothetical protein